MTENYWWSKINGISKNNKFVNTPNQSSKFKSKNWVKINDESRGTYDEDNQIRFKTSVLRSSLCDYSDYIYLLKEL